MPYACVYSHTASANAWVCVASVNGRISQPRNDVRSAHEQLTALRNLRLMTDIDDATFKIIAQLHRTNLDCAADDPCLLMCILDDVYGFDGPDDERTATAQACPV